MCQVFFLSFLIFVLMCNGQKVKLVPARGWRLASLCPLLKDPFFLLMFQGCSFFTRPCPLPCTCHVDWHICIILSPMFIYYSFLIFFILINRLFQVKDKCSKRWLDDLKCGQYVKKNVWDPLFSKQQIKCSAIFKLNKKRTKQSFHIHRV